MELFQTIETRRSVRKYLPEAVPREVIGKALSAALLAPNSSNLQPWEIYWVRDTGKKAALVTAAFDQRAASTAAELLVFVARTDTWKRNRALILEELGKRGNVPKQQLDYYTKLVPLFYSHGFLNVIGILKRPLFHHGAIPSRTPRPLFPRTNQGCSLKNRRPRLPKFHAGDHGAGILESADGGIR